MHDVVQLGHQVLKAPDDFLEAGRLAAEVAVLAQQRSDSVALIIGDG